MFGCFFSSALCSTSISLSTISQCLALEFCMSISFIASSSSFKIHVHNSVEMQIILHINTTHFNFKTIKSSLHSKKCTRVLVKLDQMVTDYLSYFIIFHFFAGVGVGGGHCTPNISQVAPKKFERRGMVCKTTGSLICGYYSSFIINKKQVNS